MSNGLPVYHVILVVKVEGHEGVPSEIRQGCIVCSKTTGVGEKLNFCHLEVGRMRVFVSLAIFAGLEEKEKTKLEKICYGLLVCVPILEVPPTLLQEFNWVWEDAVWGGVLPGCMRRDTRIGKHLS